MSLSKWDKVLMHDGNNDKYKPKKSVGEIIAESRRKERLKKLDMVDGTERTNTTDS